MARRIYKNPPIQEAICEFSFSAIERWDPYRVGRFYDAVKEFLNGEPLAEMAFQGNIPADATINAIPLPMPRFRFMSKDGRFVVLAGQESISVHVLRPYAGWVEEFRPLVERTLFAFDEAAGGLEYKKLVVRYINRVDFATEPGNNIQDYFPSAPTIPAGIHASIAGVQSLTNLVYEKEGAVLTLSFTAQGQEDKISIVLDLSVSNEIRGETLRFSDAMKRTDELRQLERDAFELCISDKLRSKFDE